jgi:hypothetical protein
MVLGRLTAADLQLEPLLGLRGLLLRRGTFHTALLHQDAGHALVKLALVHDSILPGCHAAS